MSEHEDWGEDFTALRSQLDRVADAYCEAAEWVYQQLKAVGAPRELPPSVVQLREEVEKAKERAYYLWHRFVWRPPAKLLEGELLSREEYYLAVARKGLYCRTERGNAYDDFRMLHYEDDERRCYINPEYAPRRPGDLHVQVRVLGVPPEEIAWARLRPQQRDFFERHFPEIAARFSREA